MEKKCPYCGGPMEEGFLQSPKIIAFVKKFRWLMIDESRGEFHLPFSYLKGCCFPASYCRTCEKIVISLEDQGE